MAGIIRRHAVNKYVVVRNKAMVSVGSCLWHGEESLLKR